MLGFLFSPFRALSKGCLFGIGGCFGVIIALIIIGILLGLASDLFGLPVDTDFFGPPVE